MKLEEMAARAAPETEAKAAAAADKTLPAPLVPTGKPLGHGEHRRLGAQDIFGNVEEPELIPRTPSVSVLYFLRPPQRHEQPVLPSYAKQEDSGLDALERRLVEQAGTRRQPPLRQPWLWLWLIPHLSPCPPPCLFLEKAREKWRGRLWRSSEVQALL